MARDRMFPMNRRRWMIRSALAGTAALAGSAVYVRKAYWPRRVRVVVPGRLIRGAWQNPAVLGRIAESYGFRTVVTLTAINPTDPKYIGQEAVVRPAGIDWRIIPMRGSTATLDQLAEAADLLADPALHPLFFHCVGGHHRTNLVHAAFRIRHDGWDVSRAWEELLTFPWTDPARDRDDHDLLVRFGELHTADRENSSS
jgi:protein tyrosine phosphatase (PTP) superfamily phosphohydrolase (DUF442 family)